MNPTAKLELSILGTALGLGILGDLVLRTLPWGLNAALWFTLLAAAIFFLGRSRAQLFGQGGGWLVALIVLSAFAFLWHASPVLKALNILCLMVGLSLAILRAKGAKLRNSSLLQFALGALLLVFNAAVGIFALLLGNREWNRSAGWGEVRKAVAVLLGLVLAIPPLLIFGALFMGADAVFHKLALHFLRAFPMHLVTIALIFYVVGGYLRGLILGRDLGPGGQAGRLPLSLGAIETGVFLGLLDLLFAAFVAVQIRYFFGGSALVHATTGLTYSEYARRGFFQLFAVAVLLLPFLLAAHWLLRPDDSAAQRVFRWLAGLQIVLLFVILASAFERMHLYVMEYGLSEQRLYPTAFMGWLTVVFIWFCLTVLRGERQRFAFGAMVAGFVLVAVLHGLNPDALIARTNLRRAAAGRTFDADYLAGLSADAVPDIVKGLPALNLQDRCKLSKDLLNQWSSSVDSDWRSWTISTAHARRAVQENEPALRGTVMGNCTPHHATPAPGNSPTI